METTVLVLFFPFFDVITKFYAENNQLIHRFWCHGGSFQTSMWPYFWKLYSKVRDWFEIIGMRFSPWLSVTILSSVWKLKEFGVWLLKWCQGAYFCALNRSVHPHGPTILCSHSYKLSNNLILKYLKLIFTFHIGQYILKTAIFWWMFLILRTPIWGIIKLTF